MLPQRLQRGRHRGAAPAGVQPHRPRTCSGWAATPSAPSRWCAWRAPCCMLIDTDEDAPETLREALSELAVHSGLAPLGRADAERRRRTCSSARCSARWPTRRPAASPSTWARWSVRRRPCASACRPSSGALVRSMGDAFRRRCKARSPGKLPDAGPGAAGAGPAGCAAGGRHRRADRPHDARPWLALHDRGPPAGAADRHVDSAGRLRRERRAGPGAPAWN